MGATAAVHPADPILQAYGLGKLDDASSASVSQHLEACDPCQRRVAELSSDDFLGRLQQAQVMPDKAASGWSPSAAIVRRRRRSAPPSRPRRPTLCHPNWSTTPTRRSSASSGAAAWGWSISPTTGSWGARKCSRSSAGISSSGRESSTGSSARSESAARLQHANIVTAYTAIRLGQSLVFAMEYVEGLDLATDGQDQGAAASRSRLLLHPPGGPGLAARPRARHGPPRHQAGQFDPGPRRQEGDRQGARLRPGQGDERGRRPTAT